MTATAHSRQSASHGVLTDIAVLALAMAVAVLVNTVVAGVVLTTGADPAFAPLSAGSYGPATAIGLLAAFGGWQLVRLRSRHPEGVIRLLVPVVTLLSFVPDAVLLATRFLPGTTAIGVLGLGAMHLVVLAVALPVFSRLAPLAR